LILTLLTLGLWLIPWIIMGVGSKPRQVTVTVDEYGKVTQTS